SIPAHTKAPATTPRLNTPPHKLAKAHKYELLLKCDVFSMTVGALAARAVRRNGIPSGSGVWASPIE
ncbi:hypothetical protein, partial [Bifidobacterium catulorum]|uniref:hypothetical protein n=1 Tax=Bifidobacterium catulorum TaxID=1630173 RepID=UPI0019D4395D